MKIVLVFPPFYLGPMYNMPPLGLINLAGALKGAAHTTVILDFPLAIRLKKLRMSGNIYQDCAEMILAEAPDLVGFSVQCTTYPGSIQIAGLIKSRNPDVKVVFGGHNASAVDERTLAAFPQVDSVVRGEGEAAFPELIAAYCGEGRIEDVAGLTYRIGDRIHRCADRPLIDGLDILPLPDYTLVPPLSVYRDACSIRRSIAVLEVGRGCPHRCVYCSQSVMWRRKSRTHSIDRLILEMRELSERFGAECFLLSYDQFTAQRAFVEEFCAKVIDTGLNRIPWYCISRLDGVDEPLLKLMKEAGCESMCYGIDSGSKRTLTFIRKNIDREILYRRVRETTEQGIVPTLSFVIGFPEEEKEDVDETLLLALKTGVLGNSNPLIQMATILPGTDLFLRYADKLVREIDTYFSLGIEFDDGERLASDEALIDSDPLLFCSFFNLPCPARPLSELNLIAGYFSLIVNFFPASFLTLVEEAGRSPSDLFLDFLTMVKEAEGRTETFLSTSDCLTYFPRFSLKVLQTLPGGGRAYLPELIEYERLCAEFGKSVEFNTDFFIDMHGVEEAVPRIGKNICAQRFTFPLPDIILDLKSAALKDAYPRRDCTLVFKRSDNRLDVKEINDFGAAVLGLCDGTRNVDGICGELYDRFGKVLNPADFSKECAAAVRTLRELGFLV